MSIFDNSDRVEAIISFVFHNVPLIFTMFLKGNIEDNLCTASLGQIILFHIIIINMQNGQNE